MRKLLFTGFVLLASVVVFAQNDTSSRTRPQVPLPRSNDHLMLQLGYTTWQGKPDSINTGGLPRSFNAYFLLDFPFKTNPHWSAAIGAGIATDNIYFNKMDIGIEENIQSLRFRDVSDTNHFKKYKLATAYAEAPIELRYRSNPADDRRSFKAAIGAKVGLLLNAHTKGKNLQTRSGNSLGSYTEKLTNKRFFNTNRIALTGRIGYGHFTLFTSYAVTPLFKEGQGPVVRPLTVGLTVSGL